MEAQFVARYTKNIRYTSIQTRDLSSSSAQNIRKVEIIFMGEEESRVYTKELCSAVAYNEGLGCAVGLLTNNCLLDAEEIAAL